MKGEKNISNERKIQSLRVRENKLNKEFTIFNKKKTGFKI